MKRSPMLLSSLILVVSMLFACDATLNNDRSPDPMLVNITWNLEEIETADATQGVTDSEEMELPRLLLAYDTARASDDTLVVTGFTGCNHFSASATIPAPSTIKIERLFSTLRACTQENGQYEGGLLSGLENGRTYEVENNRLTIRSATNTLRFVAAE